MPATALPISGRELLAFFAGRGRGTDWGDMIERSHAIANVSFLAYNASFSSSSRSDALRQTNPPKKSLPIPVLGGHLRGTRFRDGACFFPAGARAFFDWRFVVMEREHRRGGRRPVGEEKGVHGMAQKSGFRLLGTLFTSRGNLPISCRCEWKYMITQRSWEKKG